MPKEMPIIELKNISKSFVSKGKQIDALTDVSSKIESGKITVVIGSSGSGKSTLLRCINNLEIPTSGKVFVEGELISAINKQKICSKIGMVFQQFNLFGHMSVLRNLTYGPVNLQNILPKTAEEKAKKLLKQFGLQGKENDMPANLSGGQKQRVAICRALMMDPDVLMFDEPTSALDPEVIKDVIEIIKQLKSQLTMLVVTHHLKFAKEIADQVIFMDNGKILADEPAETFFSKSSSHRARLFLQNIGDLM